MNPTAQKLLDAHVAFLMKHLSGKELDTTISTESSIIYKWVGQQNLSDIFTEERVKAFGERAIEEFEITDTTKAYIETLVKDVLDDIAQEDIEIDDLISKNTWDRIVNKVISQRKFREELIHKLTTNKYYGEMLSEIIYNSIKSFLQQSPLGTSSSGSDRGLGGLFNVGKGLLGAALSGVEDSIDKNVKKFLSDNINKTLRDSEKIIQSRFTDENIRKAADKLWDKLDTLNFKEIADKLKESLSTETDSTSDIVSSAALEVKNAQAFRHIASFILSHFYKTYGNQPISVLFDGLLITEEKVVRESVNIAQDIVNRMHKTGFLEERIRIHLQKFYESKEVQNILK